MPMSGLSVAMLSSSPASSAGARNGTTVTESLYQKHKMKSTAPSMY